LHDLEPTAGERSHGIEMVYHASFADDEAPGAALCRSPPGELVSGATWASMSDG